MRGVTPTPARRIPRLLVPRRPILCGRALPPGLLLLALASVFAFGNDRSQFYRPGHHDWISGHHATLSANLSAEHRFVGFHRQKLDRRGEPEIVSLYNRFPIGNYVLIRLATLPAGDDIPKQILAARLLMLAFFAAAAVLAWLALARLLGDQWIALAATLLAFSSYYLLHYNDMISAEASTNLFGVMLVFHGMVLWAREGRFRQLLPKTALAVLLGWHVLGLIAPFVLLALGRELLASRADGGGVRPTDERRLRPRAILLYGAFSALCAALALGFNLGNEYRALGGEVPLHDLPSVEALLRRSGAEAEGAYAAAVAWPTFLRGQFGGIAGTAIPFAAVDLLGLGLAQPHHLVWPAPEAAPRFAAAGAAVAAACLAGLLRLPHRTLFAALLLTGWGWAMAFRGSVAYHEFEAMFHVGYPLVLYALALLGLRRLLGRRRAATALPALALAAAALFALSAALMGRVGHGVAEAAHQREVVADVEAIREIASGRSVVAHTGDGVWFRFARNYYLAGSYVQINDIGSAEDWLRVPDFDFAVVPADFGGSLTPRNRRLFLYPLGALPGIRAAIVAREPALRAAFDLRLDGRVLTYVREECAAGTLGPWFFLDIAPVDAGDLPEEGRARGYDRIWFPFRGRGVRFDGSCIARFELPAYAIAGIRTGQRQGDLPPVWEASLPVEDASFPRGASTWRETATAGEPAARGPFEVYLDGRTLTYVRDGCSGEDTADRFFVHAFMAGGVREVVNFRFRDRGVHWAGTCIASVELPPGDVRSVRTGQYDGPVHLWEEEFALGPWLARYESFAGRAPVVSAAFEVYRDGRTLTWVRGGCRPEDAEDRFFVHVHDSGGARENLDFWFRERGERHAGVCMASVDLPDGDVRSVRTGQYDETGHLWDEEFALEAEAWLARFASFAAREPTLRGAFDAHLEGRALTLARGECDASDVADRFFVHVHPADGGRREAIDFWFRERGLRHVDRCMATVALPDYAIDRVVFGQYDASGHLWEAELALGDASE